MSSRDELWTRTSIDGGRSWLPARRTDLPLGTGFPSNDGLLLQNGDLLVAVTSPEVPDRYFGAVRILRSTDDGRSWIREALLTSGPEAVGAAKRLIEQVTGLGPEEAMPLTVRTISERRASEEAREGLTAFLEKRAPKWAVRKQE